MESFIIVFCSDIFSENENVPIFPEYTLGRENFPHSVLSNVNGESWEVICFGWDDLSF